jgi:hypothetical protein
MELKERRILTTLIHNKWTTGGKTTANNLLNKIHFPRFDLGFAPTSVNVGPWN